MKLSYTLKIKLIKIFLISIITLIILSFIVIPYAYIKYSASTYAFAAKIINSLLKKEISPPIISGTTKEGGAYYLSAKTITNNILDLTQKNNGLINVTNPILMYTTGNNNLVFTVNSKAASIDTSSKIVEIPGRISVTSNQKHSAILNNVIINLQNNSIITKSPVQANYNGKILTANGLSITNGGKLLFFNGPVSISNSKVDLK